MQCYAELAPPTAVTHSVGLALTSVTAHNLVVAKASVLQIFETKTVSSDVDDDQEEGEQKQDRQEQTRDNSDKGMPDEDGGLEGSFLGPDTALLRPGRTNLTKLVLVAEVPLSGVVAGLARVAMPPVVVNGAATAGATTTSTTAAAPDALLIAYRSARMVVTVWDADRAGLAEVSLHCFEKDDMGGAPWEAPLADMGTSVEVDPGSRCVALRFGAHSLGILPFKARADNEGGEEEDDWDEVLDWPEKKKKNVVVQEEETDKNGRATSSAETAPYTSSFILQLPQMDSSLGHPIDLGFLHQYREPTFGILSGSGRQRGRGLGRRDDVSYKVFTLDLQQRASTAILSVEGLPADLYMMVALPAPAGGALLVGQNELMHVDQSGRTNGVAVNGFARLGAVSSTAAGMSGGGGGGGGGGTTGTGATAATTTATTTTITASSTASLSKISLADQSDLDLRLEGCRIEMVWPETGELLMVLSNGRLAIVSLRIDGRTVSGLSVRLVAPEAGGALLSVGASCLCRVGRSSHPCVFVGSAGSDSTLLGWTRKVQREGEGGGGGGGGGGRRRRLLGGVFDYDLDNVDLDDEDEDMADNDDDDDDDDLYGDSEATKDEAKKDHLLRPKDDNTLTAHKPVDTTFRVHDTMFSIAPIRELTPGRQVFAPDSQEQQNHAGAVADLHLGLAVGSGAAGALAIVNREIQPSVVGRFEFPEARGLWTMCVQKPVVPKIGARDEATAAAATTAAAPLGQLDLSAHFDTLMIVAKTDAGDHETSDVYALTAAGFEALTGTEFEPAAGTTVHAGPMGNHSRVVQVLRAEVRSYDGALGLCQIIPMLDEDTGAEPRVVTASIVDAYLLLVRDDGSAVIVQMDAANELDEMGRLSGGDSEWVSGCLYLDRDGVFGGKKGGVVAFAVNAEGALFIYALPDVSTPVFVAKELAAVPLRLGATTTSTTIDSSTTTTRKAPESPSPVEIIVADLGDWTDSRPHLVVRHKNNDVCIYEPIHATSEIWFKKIANPFIAPPPPATTTDDDDSAPKQHHPLPPMRACANVGGYATVFAPGPSAFFILKSAKSIPRVVGLHGVGVRAMSAFHTDGCERGFVYADVHGIARVAQLPRRTNFTALGVPARKIDLGFDVSMVAHHPPTDTYVVAGSLYEAADPTENPFGDEPVAALDGGGDATKKHHPFGPRGVIKLISPLNWSVIHSIMLEPFERVECMRTLSLEVSEETRERRLLIAIGLSISRGEDLAVRGAIVVLDVVPVIPFPDQPYTDRRLRQVAREDIPRGAVTTLAEIGAQGLMLVAQGQKCMVRGLKEDGSLLPVAFLDMSCHVSSLSELRGSGLCVMADALRGVWFAGYTEEPYRMMILGKSASNLQVVIAEFLPFGKELVIIAVDVDGDVHVVEFNPEDPKSIQGHHLLHRTTFSTAPNAPTRSLLLPSSLPPFPSATSPPQILVLSSPTGQLASITPLADAAHRRLSALQTQLAAVLPAAAGMSVKAQRAPMAPAVAPTPNARVGITSLLSAGRNVVDATVLARWADLGAAKRGEIAARVGYSNSLDEADGDGARAEIRGVLGWTGLGYF